MLTDSNLILIKAILAAILLPVFARARENARRTQCLNNLKQLGMAFAQYTQDYDEAVPTNWPPPNYPFVLTTILRIIKNSGASQERPIINPAWTEVP